MAFIENTYTIGSGGDYASFAAYVAAKERDLTAGDGQKDILKVLPGDAGLLDLTGVSWVTSPTCCIEVRPNDYSQQFAVDDIDDPDTAVASVPAIDATQLAMKLDNLDVFIDGLLMISEGGDGQETGVSMANSSPAQIKNCLLVQRSTHANCTAKGFHTGTGFTGRLTNVLSVIEAGSGYVTGKNFDIDCAAELEVLINCVSETGWNDADWIGVNLKNYAKAANTISANSVGSLGKCFGSDGNDLAKLDTCAGTDGTITTEFPYANYEHCYEDLTYSILWEDSIGETAKDSPIRKVGIIPESPDASVDAFLKERIKVDLGYHQTELCNDYDLQVFFKDMGSIVLTVRDIEIAMVGLIDIGTQAKVAQFTANKGTLDKALGTDTASQSTLVGLVRNYVNNVTGYIVNFIKSEILGVGRNAKEILKELDYWLEVNGGSLNAIEYFTNYVLDVDDATDTTLSDITIPQVVAGQRIVIECSVASPSGSEVWMVTGSEKGQFSGTAISNALFTSNVDGLQFKINLTAKDGAWTSDHGTYSVGDVVSYSAGYYICILTHIAAVGKEPTVATYWENYVKAGDKIYLYVSSDDKAIFQMFFRDHFSYCFSNVNSAGAETILDSWAA